MSGGYSNERTGKDEQQVNRVKEKIKTKRVKEN